MANKELKKMLHLCAMSAIRFYPEFKRYYERKTAEGKHKMSVINTIRNKIVLRAAAVVSKQTPYMANQGVPVQKDKNLFVCNNPGAMFLLKY